MQSDVLLPGEIAKAYTIASMRSGGATWTGKSKRWSGSQEWVHFHFCRTGAW